jgi:Lsr2
MARTQHVVETVTCDLCGKPAQEDLAVELGCGGEQWRVDLCRADYRRLASQFDKWIANGEPVSRRATGRRAKAGTRVNGIDDWVYLESLGFRRHRGRKSSAEVEALAQRAK